MAVSEKAINFYAGRYREATGQTPTRFVCPITLLDEPDAELCNGHILCDKLTSASKKTILQREDADNRFGSYVERDFVTFANFRNAKSEEMLKAGKDLTITSPTGEKMPAFFAGDEAKVRFQQLEMYDENGMTVAMPYLKSHALEVGQHKQLQVEWMFYIHKYCFTAAMLKSAYLNMFRLFGYEWVLDATGDKVRKTLAASFVEQDRKSALDLFSEFEGSCWIVGNDSGEQVDSLHDDRLLYHFIEGDAQEGLLFGISSLFLVNGALIAVTLPACNKIGHYFVSWQYYKEFILKRQLCHNMHFARIIDGSSYVSETPLSFQVVDNLPPKNTFSTRLSPCDANV